MIRTIVFFMSALVMASCNSKSRDSQRPFGGGGPNDGADSKCRLAGEWQGQFTIIEASQGSVRRELNINIPGEVRLKFTPEGAVTVEMGGMSRTHSRPGEVFQLTTGNTEMLQGVVEYSVSADRVRDVYVDHEKHVDFDISRSAHAITASVQERKDVAMTETTFTLKGDKLEVRSVRRLHNETNITVGTFTRVGSE